MPSEDFSLQSFSDMYSPSNVWQSEGFQPALQGFADAAGYQGDLFGGQYSFDQTNTNEGGDFTSQGSSNYLNPDLSRIMSGYSFKPTGQQTLGMFKGNNLVSNQTYGSKDSMFDKLAMAGIPMALSGGLGGGLAGMFGGGALGGAAGYGLANAGMADFLGGDASKAFLSGAIGGGMGGLGTNTPANLAGIDNPTFANMFNRGVGSAVGTAATGGSGSDALKNGLMSAGISGVNSLGRQGMSGVSSMLDNWLSGDDEFANLQGSGGDMSGQTDVTPSSYDDGGAVRYAGDQSSYVPQQEQKTIQSASPMSSMFSNLGSSLGNFAMNNAGDLASMLYGFYNNRKQQNALGSQINSLQGLYGQNSPYAKQLRSQLAAKAAQQGKRSNTGAREVQLQAALADRYAQLQPSMMQLNQAKGTLQNSLGSNTIGMLNKMGGFNAIGQGLQSLFGPNTYQGGGANITGMQNPYGSDVVFNGWQ